MGFDFSFTVTGALRISYILWLPAKAFWLIEWTWLNLLKGRIVENSAPKKTAKTPKEKLEDALNNAVKMSQSLTELETAELIEEWAEGWSMRAKELRIEELERG